MRKLFKHDFLNFFRKHLLFIIFIFANLLLVIGTEAILKELTGNMLQIVSTLFGILNTVLYLSIIALPFFTVIVAIINFKNKLLGDEGYLTHTLPVTKNQINLAKISNVVIYLIIDILLIALILIIRFGITELLEFINYGIGITPDLIPFIIITLMLTMITFYNLVTLAFTLGYAHETKKIKHTIIYGVIIYILNQFAGMIISALAFLLVYITDGTIMNMVILASMSFYTIAFFPTTMLKNKFLDSKLNLE